MILPTTVQVLIVGGGPTGLIAAATLAESGLQVALVDSSERNYNGSRAAVVHSRTLEVLDTIGLAKPVIDSGTQCDKISICGTTNKLLELNLWQLRDTTEFPFSVFIPQHEVERIFRNYIVSKGVQIFRNKAVIGMRQVDDSVFGIEVAFGNGDIIRTQYVIGADGSRSTIRRLVGIDFKDPHTGVDYEDSSVPPAFYIILADVYLEEPLPTSIPRDTVSAHVNNFLLLIPLCSNENGELIKFWRIGYPMPVGKEIPPKEPSLEYLQLQMDERNPWDTRIKIASVITASRYKVRAAIASSYFQKFGGGNVLLAGDAAHVHSPVGGQGMNLGICDAVAAAQAIRLHVEAKLSSSEDSQGDTILQSYSQTRRKIGLRVLGLTKGLTTVVNSSTGWRRILRNLILRLVSYVPYINRYVAWRISGLINRDG